MKKTPQTRRPKAPNISQRTARAPEKDIATFDRAKASKAIALIQTWLDDETGYDEATWPIAKRAIEENRMSEREKFADYEFLLPRQKP